MKKPIISIIAAVAKNKVIGRGKELPWRIPADMAYFKKATFGFPVIMGGNTHQSINKILPGRKNIVISDIPDFIQLEGAFKVDSFKEAFDLTRGEKEVFIIGGAFVYKQALNFADRLYLTEIQSDVEGDVYFPDFDKNLWREIKNKYFSAGKESPYDLNFVIYERI